MTEGDGMLVLGSPDAWTDKDDTTQIVLAKPTRRDLGQTLLLAAKCRNPNYDWSER